MRVKISMWVSCNPFMLNDGSWSDILLKSCAVKVCLIIAHHYAWRVNWVFFNLYDNKTLAKTLMIFQEYSLFKRIYSKIASLVHSRKVWRNEVDINHINPFQITQAVLLFLSIQFNFHFSFCGCISLKSVWQITQLCLEKKISASTSAFRPTKNSNAIRFGCDIYRWNKTDLPKSTTKTEFYVTRSWKSKSVMAEVETTVVPSKYQSKVYNYIK